MTRVSSASPMARAAVALLTVLILGVQGFFAGGAAEASPADPKVIKQAQQPNGETFAVRLWGDEFAHGWEIAATGHTVVRNPASGYWVYAIRAASGGLQPSGVIPGRGAAPAAPRL